MKHFLSFLGILMIFCGCSQQKPIEITGKDYHTTVDQITDVIVHDIFSPPVASRIYAYCNIAAYEIIVQGKTNFQSFAEKFKNFTPIPKVDTTKQVNLHLAALVAHLEIGKQLTFSEERIKRYQDSLYQVWQNQNEVSFVNSKEYGIKVAQHLEQWMNTDNYKETRSMPKYSVYSDDLSRWQPTPPSYMSGIEPHWAKIRPFAIDSASQFKPERYPEFSLEENSVFLEELMEVYDVKLEMEENQEKGKKLEIAQFWDCNPYVTVQRGHLMFATKKITPGAHWIGICKIASEKSNLDFEESVYAYTTTSLAIADAFISCWDEKYRSNLIRPETLINQYVDKNWSPVLQTPPFPEYPSGHSVISGAAATMLTQLFGEGFSFLDTSEEDYGLPARSFTSFNQAAKEAAISRLYGGIHYRFAIEEGLIQGNNLGDFIVQALDIQTLTK